MKNLRSKSKNVKGITLISLVVTIIILLIISSVSIGIIIGNNGLINRAKTAKEQYQNAVDEENKKLEEIYSKLLLADTEGTSLENIDMTTLKALIRQEGNPTGTIIAFYGEVAPNGYIACDGTTYDLTQEDNKKLKALATFLGAGDNPTSLTAPDLRGEFLRGTGTNITTGYSGENVGIHQDATLRSNFWSYDSGKHLQFYPNKSDYVGLENADKNIISSIGKGGYYEISGNFVSYSNPVSSKSAMRPTNTSVLYCIKY